MESKSKQLVVTEAKVIRSNGSVEYYYSLPKISLFNISGMVWLWKRLKEYKKLRKRSKEIITKVNYN